MKRLYEKASAQNSPLRDDFPPCCCYSMICLLEGVLRALYLNGEKTDGETCYCMFLPNSAFCDVMLVAGIGFPFPSSVALTPTHM